MKKLILKLSLLVLISFCLCDCTKTNSPINITLYNKPLPVIKSYINGTWQLRYDDGRFGNGVYPATDTILYTFNDDEIKIVNNSSLFVDTTINWLWMEGVGTSGDSTFVMNYYVNAGYPVYYVLDKIYNDTLILHTYSYGDVLYSHFTKSK